MTANLLDTLSPPDYAHVELTLRGAEVYLVGGAVRDAILGRDVSDNDYVVVGAIPALMEELEYKRVGNDFPVYLHPMSGEEYALARTERRTGDGHTGFTVDASPIVTIEEDLSRRDFTMNAIAINTTTRDVVDPFGGEADIDAGVIRHVGPAFAEDPLRVLRAARFAARYAHLDFAIAPETMALMTQMVADGMLEHLTPERVWKELHQTFCSTDTPSVFIRVLRECGALKVVLPEVEALYGVPQHAEWHPEIDTGIHTEMVMDQAAKLSNRNPAVVFAAMVHDLGKALTDPATWPAHVGHEESGVVPVWNVCSRLRLPSVFTQIAGLVCQEHLNFHRIEEMRPAKVYNLIERCGGLRRPDVFDFILIACEADARGRLGLEDRNYTQTATARAALQAAQAVTFASLPSVDREGIPIERSGQRIGEDLRVARIAAIRQALKKTNG